MDHIEREYMKAIATNLGRIATVLEDLHTEARESRNVDVSKILQDAMDALRKTNPAFDMAMTAMEKQLLGPGSNS